MKKPAKRSRGKQVQPKSHSEKALTTSRNYWQSIEKITGGRYLHGIEWAIASDAWTAYVKELRRENPDAEIPDEPKLATVPKTNAGELATIAALLIQKNRSNSLKDAKTVIPKAHDLLIQSATYLKNLESKSAKDSMHLDGITFDLIQDSNQKDNEATLKLLPGHTGGKASVGNERYKGLIKLIRRYYSKRDGASSSSVVSIEDLSGEEFIKKKMLPTSELVRIRAWSYREKRAVK